jgi:Protein of unknown function (DUF3800)
VSALQEREESAFSAMLDSIAPSTGDIIVIIKSYFDESYDNNSLCIAGYSFASAKARALDDEWRKMLARYKRLPFFRMSACNAHHDPFDRLTDQECIAIATDAIKLINKYAEYGCAVTVDQKVFNKIVTKKGLVSTPYEFCSWICLIAVTSAMNQRFPTEVMSFFFEAGFKDQGLANKMLNGIFADPRLREKYRYKSHTFIDKQECRPTQAADLLAWQWYKDLARRTKGLIKPRGDLRALVNGTPHHVLHASAEQLQQIVDMINAKAGAPMGNEMASLAMVDLSEKQPS